MKTIQKSTTISLSLLTLIFFMSFINPIYKTISNSSFNVLNETKQKASNDIPKPDKPLYKVTFIELGSVRCIPCRKMQSVMKSIEKKYGSQVKVVFHDVWTDAGKPFGELYKITAIPTQVLLDVTGKEFFRHEGYFPEEELVKVLHTKGVY